VPAENHSGGDQPKSLKSNDSEPCRDDAASGNAPHPTPPTVKEKKESPPLSSTPPSPAYHATEFHPRFQEVREYIVGRLPNLARQNATEVNRWLLEGADPEKDIFPSIDNAIEFKRGDIGSFRYFTRSVESSVAVRKEMDEQDQRLRSKYAKPE
jgi:hypothetical protein